MFLNSASFAPLTDSSKRRYGYLICCTSIYRGGRMHSQLIGAKSPYWLKYSICNISILELGIDLCLK